MLWTSTNIGGREPYTVRAYRRLMAEASEIRWDPTVPRSVQIADEIERRIRAGVLAPKAPVLETRLVQEFGVARETARKATRILRDRGLIFTVRGMGSFVSSASSGDVLE